MTEQDWIVATTDVSDICGDCRYHLTRCHCEQELLTMNMEPSLCLRQFGADFAVPARIISDSRVEDVSYGNDVCPSFIPAGSASTTDTRTLWVDHVDPTMREVEGALRFTVTNPDYTIAFQSETDAAGAVEALLSNTTHEGKH